jgi:hypothetical protein
VYSIKSREAWAVLNFDRTTWPRLIFVHHGSVLRGLGCMLGDIPDGSMNGRELVPAVPNGFAGPDGALPALPKGLTGFGAPRC